MRKREIIQLHVLGGLVKSELADRDALSPEALAAYRSHDVFPAELYVEKYAHRDAVFDLYDGLATSVNREAPEASVEAS